APLPAEVKRTANPTAAARISPRIASRNSSAHSLVTATTMSESNRDKMTATTSPAAHWIPGVEANLRTADPPVELSVMLTPCRVQCSHIARPHAFTEAVSTQGVQPFRRY